MKIFITGNQGYVGSVLSRHLREVFPDAELVGYDNAWFAHCLTGATTAPERFLDQQYFGDTRNVPEALLAGVDAVVHLAAVSNDPIGNKFGDVTHDINQDASVELAMKASRAGVRNFVFASSCSVYGFAVGAPRSETDDLNPQTAYARSKVGTERALSDLDLSPMVLTSLRFATACGWSDRLRLDLVLNDFVAGALSTGTVTVLSDGSPWRPLIDVQDMARAIEWACLRDGTDGGPQLSVNTGSLEGNYQVKDLAARVAEMIPGTTVSINQQAQPDNRSYQVDFSLYWKVAPHHTPRMRLEDSIVMLRDGLSDMKFRDAHFRISSHMRLRVLEDHLETGRLDRNLRWNSKR